MYILGIAGKKKSGKTTLATALTMREHLLGPVRALAFADPLKKIGHELFGIPLEWLYGTDEEKENLTQYRWVDMPGVCWACCEGLPPGKHESSLLTVREWLQHFATQGMRVMNVDCWVNAFMSQADKLQEAGFNLVVAHDVRFDNECDAIRSRGGKVIQLTRGKEGDSHVSERGVSQDKVDAIIENRYCGPGTQLQMTLDLLSTWGWF
jgi:hypothetical protein